MSQNMYFSLSLFFFFFTSSSKRCQREGPVLVSGLDAIPILEMVWDNMILITQQPAISETELAHLIAVHIF